MDGVRTFLRGLGQTLITLGIVVLLFCVYELYFTNLYTDKQQAKLGDQLEHSFSQPAPPPGSKLASVLPGQALAIIRIPHIGMTGKVGHGARVVVEGVS